MSLTNGSSDVAAPYSRSHGNLMVQAGLSAALLFASPIRSSGVQDFSAASLGPRNLPVKATLAAVRRCL
jgi:hypothetical protein